MLTFGGIAAALVGLSPAVAMVRNGRAARFRYVVIDGRVPASIAFGDAAASISSGSLDVSRGLTRLWQTALDPLWRDGGGAVVGLTDFGACACLTEQARSHGLRSMCLGQHSMDPGMEEISRALNLLSDAAILAASTRPGRAYWPRTAAALGRSRSPSPFSPHLLSWIIA